MVGKDGWRGEYVKVKLSNGDEVICPVNRWIDDKVDGLEMTLGCFPNEVPSPPATTIDKIITKTSDITYAETNNGVLIEFCNNGNCCETKLDNVNENEFAKNTIDTFEGSSLTPCQLYPVTEVKSIRMRLVGKDGWRGEYVKVKLSNGSEVKCPINRWIDDELDGLEMTLACNQI